MQPDQTTERDAVIERLTKERDEARSQLEQLTAALKMCTTMLQLTLELVR